MAFLCGRLLLALRLTGKIRNLTYQKRNLLIFLYFLYSGGLQPGDIVTHINKKEIKNSSDVYDALGDGSKELDISILRGVKQLRVTITPEDP